MASAAKDALSDLMAGLRQWRMALWFSWEETRLRYRRSFLGPLWITLGLAIMIAGMGFIWSTLWSINPSEFFPYLTAGLIIWNLVIGATVKGCEVYVSQGAIVRSIPVPLTIPGLRNTIDLMITFVHQIVVFVLVALIFGVPVTLWTLLFVPALALVMINAFWASMLFGIIGARFRDLAPIMTSIMMLAFFVTPVIWQERLLGKHHILADINPLAHVVDVLRQPMLGQPADLLSWSVVIGMAIIGSWVTFLVFVRYRRLVVYWL